MNGISPPSPVGGGGPTPTQDLALAPPEDLAPQGPPPDLAPAPDLLPCTHLTQAFDETPAGWLLAGDATVDANDRRLDLTGTGAYKAGSAFYATPLSVHAFDARFTLYFGGGSGGDGAAMVLARAQDPAALAPTDNGNNLGYRGLDGWALAFDSFYNAGDPGANYIAFARAADATTFLLGTPPLLHCNCELPVHVRFDGIHLRVEVEGKPVIDSDLPAGIFQTDRFYFGFTGASGGFTDHHEVSHLDLIVGPPGVCFQ